ncbi:16S rRNA (adenine(1518)-N(6)/adenine(1519)-N(6))-dimethyltransferase RsmA [Corynebacterium sp. TAE3-ERU12]|uniref:16S rRNA (adenine(1518)-N(6)/adenine(1519)-N(6))- dimethyltransferase RsmA n=1 Tax=Corynebacterium sp. TAE3-ERU12 TaxID=2849491 RepID=UPI001C44D0A0|nr:16S rRNA (adenine(1518)-N(6)/adenine(1519)-N(6))-dimethyltransferase RsmA [Corynebacterium sp. TAE3-ERU12]MBV7295623.1 16S rRNA (adenine(1518)-N(6)/adenine(1519)-N(6))-dimethyltransferase RsmA [Corynebacterium sp. TAE3-ERU12]
MFRPARPALIVVEYLGPADIRELADELGVTPAKKLGQNFVHDSNTVRRIVDAAVLSSDDYPVEVGPGLGSLTLGLLDTCGRAAAIEIDPRLAEKLPTTVAQRAPGAQLHLIAGDAMNVRAQDFPEAPTALVANLPYNVSVPVLLHLLAELPSVRRVLVMVQAEVADRLAAAPGSKIYGVPSVKASYYGRVRNAGNIGRNVFWPVPNVDSKLVQIDIFAEPREVPASEVWPIVDAAFAQRRKTLRAALAGHYGSAAAAEEALRAAGIDPKLRGERLSVNDYVRLASTSRNEGHSS